MDDAAQLALISLRAWIVERERAQAKRGDVTSCAKLAAYQRTREEIEHRLKGEDDDAG